MTTCLQSGIGLPDIVSLEGEQMAKFGEKFPGKFEEFTDMINKDDFFPIKIAECTIDDKIIAYPWDSGRVECSTVQIYLKKWESKQKIS